MGKKEDNVLLIAMSTLPQNVKDLSVYVYAGELDKASKLSYFSGMSQLEPGTKYYLNLLARRNCKIHRIVILCTKEAAADPVGIYNDKEVTALSLYEERIKAYIRGQGELRQELNGVPYDLEQIPGSVHYSDEEIENLFQVVQDIGTPESSDKDIYFWEAVQKILGGGEKSDINLYMDMQGGHRKISAQMDAIVSLLNARGVKIKLRIATAFNVKDAQKNPQWIQDVSSEYKTYDLVTAMTIFSNYGRGKELRQYLGESELTNAVLEASESIALCDVGRFDETIEKLKEIVMNDDGSRPRTQVDVVMEDIRNSFSDLWKNDLHYVRQIRWCLKRNFIQQALTLLEARMPYEYVVNGLKYYCGKDDNKQTILEQFEHLYLQVDPRKEGYRFLDIDHYYIKNYHRSELNSIPKHSLLPEYKTGRINNSIREYKRLCNKRNSLNHAAQTYPEGGFYHYMKEKYGNTADHSMVWSQGSRESEEELIGNISAFLDRFEKLAREAANTGKLNEIIDLR